MKFRSSHSSKHDIVLEMTPMIDVVFLLLIFFMLQLKIVSPEGDFNVNMPIAAPSADPDMDLKLPLIKVRLEAADDGSLSKLSLNRQVLGNDDSAFARLSDGILNIVGPPGSPMTKEIEVEIDFDYNLNYSQVVRAVSTCTGKIHQGKLVRFVDKITFAQARPPGGA